MKNNFINISFDTRTDAKGKDPDSASSTLKKYHKLLWSKALSDGRMFNLEYAHEKGYLHHISNLGEFYLSSDSIVHTYFRWKRMQHIIMQVPKQEIDYFYNIAHTIGGYILFPGNKVNGKYTINQERGINNRINDRIDLTLECIRQYYLGEESPLYKTLFRYDLFFKLFSNFKGYCDYFLLQDLITDDINSVKFFLPFEGFTSNPLPRDIEEYNLYMRNNIEFIKKRNSRIENYNIKR